MKVKINGKEEEVKETTILDLLKSRKVEPEMVSVEFNSRVLDRKEYQGTKITDGDVIEFLYFMGGG